MNRNMNRSEGRPKCARCSGSVGSVSGRQCGIRITGIGATRDTASRPEAARHPDLVEVVEAGSARFRRKRAQLPVPVTHVVSGPGGLRPERVREERDCIRVDVNEIDGIRVVIGEGSAGAVDVGRPGINEVIQHERDSRCLQRAQGRPAALPDAFFRIEKPGQIDAKGREGASLDPSDADSFELVPSEAARDVGAGVVIGAASSRGAMNTLSTPCSRTPSIFAHSRKAERSPSIKTFGKAFWTSGRECRDLVPQSTDRVRRRSAIHFCWLVQPLEKAAERAGVERIAEAARAVAQLEEQAPGHIRNLDPIVEGSPRIRPKTRLGVPLRSDQLLIPLEQNGPRLQLVESEPTLIAGHRLELVAIETAEVEEIRWLPVDQNCAFVHLHLAIVQVPGTNVVPGSRSMATSSTNDGNRSPISDPVHAGIGTIPTFIAEPSLPPIQQLARLGSNREPQEAQIERAGLKDVDLGLPQPSSS